jgi:hypothetical protein
MKKHIVLPIIITIVLSLFLLQCAEEPQKSLWELEPNYEVKPDPTISNVEPEYAYAAISEVTIHGTNFDPTDNYIHTRVYFGSKKAQTLSMTSEEIKCIAPNIEGDSLIIKVQVDGAMLFGESEPYKVVAAWKEYGGITGAFNAYGIAIDLNENLYVSLEEGKILKVTPAEEQIDYATADQGVDGFYRTMKMGPGSVLYAARTIFLYQFPAGVMGTRARMSKTINDFDFDENLNIFYSSQYAIYLVRQDMTDTLIANYPQTILSTIRVYDGYVYVGGYYTGTDPSAVKKGIWRNQILDVSGNLGTSELVFDWNSYFPSGAVGVPNILSITFAADGDLYVGADSTIISNAVTVIHRDGDGNYLPENTEPLYPAVLIPPSTNMIWGNDQYLYVNRRTTNNAHKRIIRLTTGKNSAPYYGRR